MKNFRFHVETDVHFGTKALLDLPKLLRQFGTNVLLTYGGGSIKHTGLYDKITALLQDFQIFELSGIEPNPRLASVKKGVEICKKQQIDVILAVGGGSTIDCSKAIAGGAFYDGDPWDLVTNPKKIEKALPVVTVLTLAATGSEMNGNAVITNWDTNEKLGTYSDLYIPRASILDPTVLYTLPAKQTAAGTADILSHLFEQYFQKEEGAYVSDRFAEGLMKTCIKYCPIALLEPDNYEARANLMWASTMALNGLTSCGKTGAWTCHPIEHELSAYYDITHGEGLAIVTPRWMRYILKDETVEKFAAYARNVWDVPEGDLYEMAKQGIDLTEQFFSDCGIPMSLSQLGIDQSKFEIMAEKAVKFGGLAYAYQALTKEDVVAILEKCL